MKGNELVVSTQQNNFTALSLNEMKEIGSIFVQSGLFPNDRDLAKALVKIIAGQELGVAPFQAISNIHFINGVRCLSYPLIAALIQKSGRYKYRVTEETATSCKMEWFERDDNGEWELIGTSDFTEADAQAANLLGKSNWKQYKKDLLFARCLTRGARRYCSSVFAGGGVYTNEEIESGGVVGEDNTDDLKGIKIDDFVAKVKAEIDETLTKEVIIENLKTANFGGWATANKRAMFDYLKIRFSRVEEAELVNN